MSSNIIIYYVKDKIYTWYNVSHVHIVKTVTIQLAESKICSQTDGLIFQGIIGGMKQATTINSDLVKFFAAVIIAPCCYKNKQIIHF